MAINSQLMLHAKQLMVRIGCLDALYEMCLPQRSKVTMSKALSEIVSRNGYCNASCMQFVLFA
jgi:hypothetical protein